MSTKESAKKAIVFNEGNEALYDAFPAVQLPDYFPANPPWPEWSDADVNSETWGNGRFKSQTATKVTGKSQVGLETLPYYSDPEPGALPPELANHVAAWKRPREVFPEESLTIYDGSAPECELTCPSEHASNCELFRAVSDVCCLLRFYAEMEPFPMECETPSFTSNTKGQPWQPWHHVYGLCKAGKDQPHRPVYYPYGKYILRLYYLGAWRKFTVDDQVPCDEVGRPLLPVTQRTGELWPILLVKGIMKVAALTPTSRPATMNLPVWTLLTGWIEGSFQAPGKTTAQTWRLIHALTPNFAYQEHRHQTQVVPSISSKGTAKKAAAVAASCEKRTTKLEERPSLVVAELGDFPPESNLGRSSCLVAVLMTRNVPLVKSKVRKATEPWKRIRWVHWAASKGLWMDEQLIPPYRCLYQLSFDRALNDLLRVDPDTEGRLFMPEDAADDADSGQEDESDSPLQWIDFYKFNGHLRKLSFLLRPSSLVSSYWMTYVNLGGCPGRTYYILPTVQMSGNEPPTLFCESLTGVFITFCLWVWPYGNFSDESYLSDDQPEVLTVYRGSLVVEKYDWWSTRQCAVLAAVKTVGRSASCVFLSPGRHALRMWLDADSPFVVEIHADTELTVGKGPKIRFAMSTETLLIMNYVTKLSVAFIELVQKFGRPDHANNLRNFFLVIRPSNTIAVDFRNKMNCFLDAVAVAVSNVLKSLVTNEEELRWMVKGLRSLFAHPDIPGGAPKAVRVGGSVIFQKRTRKEVAVVDRRERGASECLNRSWTQEEVAKAVTVQRIFRGFRVRQALGYRFPTCRDHKLVAEKLRKVCDLIFVPSKRDVEVARLIREVVAIHPDLLETFTFHKDLPNVTVTEEFTGKITGVEPKAWVPMIRFIFACHSSDPLPCAFYHSCNLEQYTVTVTDNDTNEEIFRLVNATCPHYYHRNQAGYTLFVYGWNENDPKTVNWRLEMVKMKYFLDIHPCNTTLIGITGNLCHPYQPQPLSMQEIRNFYIPNKQNKICTCLLKVRKRMHLTIRLAMSFEDARFYTRITRGGPSESEYSLDGTRTVIEAETKSSSIIFPSVLLVHDPQSKDEPQQQSNQTVYVLEAFVMDNSWPLTCHEWGIVEPIRVNGEPWDESLLSVTTSQSRKSSLTSRRKSTRPSKLGVPTSVQKIESPYWNLQVVTDASSDLSQVLEVTEDRSYPEMIRGMKLSWEESDPGRRQHGRSVRRNFLRRIFDERMETRRGTLQNEMSEETRSGSLVLSKESDLHLSGDDGFETLIHEMGSFSYLVQNKSSERHLRSPRILPWTPMEELVAKYSRGKSEADVMSSLESSRNIPGEDYIMPDHPKDSEVVFEDERKNFLREMMRQVSILEEHFAREKMLSRQLMEEAIEDRRKVITRMKATRSKMEVKAEKGEKQTTK